MPPVVLLFPHPHQLAPEEGGGRHPPLHGALLLPGAHCVPLHMRRHPLDVELPLLCRQPPTLVRAQEDVRLVLLHLLDPQLLLLIDVLDRRKSFLVTALQVALGGLLYAALHILHNDGLVGGEGPGGLILLQVGMSVTYLEA